MSLTHEMEAALKVALLTGDLHALLRHIPDAVFFSETQRRRGAKTVNRSGGAVWSKHRPDYSRCRCRACNAKRKQPAAQ